MYTAAKRATALGSLALTAAMTLCAAVAMTTFVLQTSAGGEVQLNVLQIQRVRDMFTRNEVEMADVQLSVDANVDGLFHWNTKHVYVSIVAEYSSSKKAFNQIVLWDTVIGRTDSHHILLNDKAPKYPLVDSFFGLRGAQVNVSLHWDIVPYTGVLTAGQTEPKQFTLPE